LLPPNLQNHTKFRENPNYTPVHGHPWPSTTVPIEAHMQLTISSLTVIFDVYCTVSRSHQARKELVFPLRPLFDAHAHGELVRISG